MYLQFLFLLLVACNLSPTDGTSHPKDYGSDFARGSHHSRQRLARWSRSVRSDDGTGSFENSLRQPKFHRRVAELDGQGHGWRTNFWHWRGDNFGDDFDRCSFMSQGWLNVDFVAWGHHRPGNYNMDIFWYNGPNKIQNSVFLLPDFLQHKLYYNACTVARACLSTFVRTRNSNCLLQFEPLSQQRRTCGRWFELLDGTAVSNRCQRHAVQNISFATPNISYRFERLQLCTLNF